MIHDEGNGIKAVTNIAMKHCAQFDKGAALSGPQATDQSAYPVYNGYAYTWIPTSNDLYYFQCDADAESFLFTDEKNDINFETECSGVHCGSTGNCW